MARPKPIPDRSPEAELAGLITTRDNLRARQTALAAEVEQAVAARRELLIGNADAAAISGVERTCRELEGTALGVSDALAEVERRIQATEQRIEEARAAGEREAAAATLERDGKAIDTAADRVRRAVEDLAKAGDALAAAITPTSAPLFAKRDMTGVRNTEPPERVAAFLVGHMIATIIPALDVAEAGRQEKFGWISAKPIEATDGDEPAKVLLTDPMRMLAELVRSGETSPVLARTERPEPDFEPGYDEVEIFPLEEFTYLRRTGYLPEIVSVRQQRIPTPVAEEAIRQGLASRAMPENWATLLQQAAAGSRYGRSVFETAALGFNLEEWRAAEAKRRRDAWLAEQREAA